MQANNLHPEIEQLTIIKNLLPKEQPDKHI